MAKRKNDFFDDVFEKGERRAKRRIKKKVKKMHLLTKILAVLFLAVGVGLGVLTCSFLSRNDHFVLKGETQISLEAGNTYVYKEEGVVAVCFGRSCAGKVKVQASRGITKDANGNYVIPAEEGVYTLTYTVDNLKFGGKLGGEKILRIRTFTVDAVEEDGRNG